MFDLPQLPDWNALHVLVIHFPLGLLMLALPVLLGLALVVPKHSKPLAAAAGMVLVVGTGCCYLAASTGSAAGQLAVAQGVLEDPAIHETYEKHEHMALDLRSYVTYFSALFLVYLLVIGVRREPLPAAANAAILLLFLAGSAALALGLGNAAHEGGLLVHTHGITANLEPGAGEAAAAAAAAMDAAEPDAAEAAPDEAEAAEPPAADAS